MVKKDRAIDKHILNGLSTAFFIFYIRLKLVNNEQIILVVSEIS